MIRTKQDGILYLLLKFLKHLDKRNDTGLNELLALSVPYFSEYKAIHG